MIKESTGMESELCRSGMIICLQAKLPCIYTTGWLMWGIVDEESTPQFPPL